MELWIQGNTVPLKEFSWMRPYLLSLYGERCWGCGFEKRHPVDGKVPLQIEHTDGVHKNNHIDNVRLLCGACHSLTLTYGNRKRQ